MRFYLLILLLLYPCIGQSDVVKPALIEINVLADNTLEIEIRASIEAILTGINSQYKNTQDAPQAQSYDALRQAQASVLAAQFNGFSKQFIAHIWLTADHSKVPLTLESVDIPEPGYTKVPRISTLKLSATLPKATGQLQWYYPASFSDNAVRVRQSNRVAKQWHWGQWQWIRDNQPSKPIVLKEFEVKAATLATFAQYLVIGFRHIVPKGSDHLLFILGLFLSTRHWRPLLLQVSTFTVAHTLTLGLAALGVFSISPSIVEPLIALSIIAIGLECLRNRPVGKMQLMTVFIFGLLHGLGFATAMSAFNLSPDLFITALIGFNLGVEFSQVFVLLGAWVTIGWWIPKDKYRKFLVIPMSILICLIGLTWFIDRVL